jgi:hypothetical protein
MLGMAMVGGVYVAGCHRATTAVAPPRPAKPAASVTPPLPVAAEIGGLDVTMLDELGRPVAKVTAHAGVVRPTPRPSGSDNGSTNAVGDLGGSLGQLLGSDAVLYQKGKPQARMTADSVQADESTHAVNGVGNVVVRSLALPDAPTIRADRMTWRYGTGTITGSGHVLVTREPDLRIPATSFTADTRLQKFVLNGNAGPGSGTF